MSQLAVGQDDHPEAAEKHFEDAKALRAADRFDGCAYHAGYVVECALKTVVLWARTVDPQTGVIDQTKLKHWHQQLRAQYGHKVQALLQVVTAEGADYLPPLQGSQLLQQWQESMRYWPAGKIPVQGADEFLVSAKQALDSVLRMRLDGIF